MGLRRWQMRYKPHKYQTQATGFIINHDEAAVFLGMV